MRTTPTYCKRCDEDKLCLNDDNLCEQCVWEIREAIVGNGATGTTESPGENQAKAGGQRFISPEGLRPRPARWLWEHRIPIGVATLIAGVPGQGKSHVCLDIAAKVTRGELAGHFEGTPAGAVVMSSEDMLLETIVPRLIAAGADMSRVFILPFTDDGFDVEKDLAQLEAQALEQDVRLVILDPLLAFTPGDGFKEAEVRRMLKPAQRLMAEARLAILGVMHLNKDVMMDVLSRVTHSQAFTALVRSVLFVGADPDDEDELNPSKVLAHGKSNLGRIAPSVGFRLIETVVAGEDEGGADIGVTTSAVEWLGESEVTAEQLVKGRGSAGTKQAQAEGLLLRLCAGGKAVGKQTVLLEAERLGISPRTLERAYQHLGGEPATPARDPDTGQLTGGVWRIPRSHD